MDETRYPNIDDLIQSDGEITLGRVGLFPCTAIANADHGTLAMLVRRRDESLMALLDRLEAAIEDAIEREVYVDEING
jgi:hypothetical protein